MSNIDYIIFRYGINQNIKKPVFTRDYALFLINTGVFKLSRIRESNPYRKTV